MQGFLPSCYILMQVNLHIFTFLHFPIHRHIQGISNILFRKNTVENTHKNDWCCSSSDNETCMASLKKGQIFVVCYHSFSLNLSLSSSTENNLANPRPTACIIHEAAEKTTPWQWHMWISAGFTCSFFSSSFLSSSFSSSHVFHMKYRRAELSPK